jgi:error-prone DNA polymerase
MAAKRSLERMRKLETQLREGMAARGITGAAADSIVQGITSFALYGFPESHAASFALIAYASAYLKAHHPVEFLCALLNGWPMGFYHPATLIQDARRHGVRVLPIDVHHSAFVCRLECLIQGSGVRGPGLGPPFRPRFRVASPELSPWLSEPRAPSPEPRLAVRLGLRYVKGIREETARRIAEEAALSPFASVQEVARRCRLRDDELAALAQVGAFASLGETRRSALWQVSALDGRRPPLAQAMQPAPGPSPLPEMTLKERYIADYEGAGITVGAHPLVMRRAELHERGILSAIELNRKHNGARARIGGVVIVRQRPATAKGLCFATLEDETGFANVVFMPDFYKANRATITGCALLEVAGIVQARDGVVTLRADHCQPLFTAAPAPPARNFH